MRVICVIAGNLREFHSFVKEKCWNATKFVVYPNGDRAMIDGVNYRYVRDINSIRGLNGAQYICYGTYLNRKDLDHINQEVMAQACAEGVKL